MWYKPLQCIQIMFRCYSKWKLSTEKTFVTFWLVSAWLRIKKWSERILKGQWEEISTSGFFMNHFPQVPEHKVLTYVEYRAVPCVFQNIDSPGGEGGGGSIFLKTSDIGLSGLLGYDLSTSLSITFGPFRIFPKIRGDIRSSRCSTASLTPVENGKCLQLQMF